MLCYIWLRFIWAPLYGSIPGMCNFCAKYSQIHMESAWGHMENRDGEQRTMSGERRTSLVCLIRKMWHRSDENAIGSLVAGHCLHCTSIWWWTIYCSFCSSCKTTLPSFRVSPLRKYLTLLTMQPCWSEISSSWNLHFIQSLNHLPDVIETFLEQACQLPSGYAASCWDIFKQTVWDANQSNVEKREKDFREHGHVFGLSVYI